MSIKLKMALWYGMLTAILLGVFLSSFYCWLSKSMYDNPQDKARDTADKIASDLAPGNCEKFNYYIKIIFAFITNPSDNKDYDIGS